MILTNVVAKDIFDLLLLEFTSNDETASAVHRSCGTQFGEQILNSVLRRSVHALADIRDIGKHSLLVSFPCNTGRCDDITLASIGEQSGVSSMQLAVEASQELGCCGQNIE